MTTAMMEDAKRMYRLTWWALMLRGLLSLAVGGFIFARPLDSVAAFALVIAFWALFVGSVEIVQSFELKAMMKHWWVLLSPAWSVSRSASPRSSIIRGSP